MTDEAMARTEAGRALLNDLAYGLPLAQRRRHYADAILAIEAEAALAAPAGLDVETLANRLAERTLLLQKALDDPSKPFIENWRTVARVLLDQPLARSQEPTP